MSALDLARWAAGAFASYDRDSTHRIVTAATGPGALPDHVSARIDPLTGTVLLPRPVGVVLARVAPDPSGSTDPVDQAVRLALLTRNAILLSPAAPASTAADGMLPVDAWHAAVADRVARIDSAAVHAGAPEGLVQLHDGIGEADLVLPAVSTAPVLVIADDTADPALLSTVEPGSVLIATSGRPARDVDQALRMARAVLRESGGDRVRVLSTDPDLPLRIAAALPVRRVAVNAYDLPPSTPDGLVTWIHLNGGGTTNPWSVSDGPVPAYPVASNLDPGLRRV